MRRLFSQIAALGVAKDNPALGRAQLSAFARHIPYMYAIVGICTIGLAYEHAPYAPTYLYLGVPAVLLSIVIVRITQYFRLKPEKLSDAEVNKRLRTVVILAAVLGSCFISWALFLFGYGDTTTKSHVVLYASITVFGIMVCLLHLRFSAIVIGFTTIGPLAVTLILSGSTMLITAAVNVVLVAVLFAIVLRDNADDFARMIDHQETLKKRHAETQALSDANYKIANLDSLTGLPNRRSFFAQLNSRMVGALEGEADPLAVGILDLDGFKPINDIYGHSTGDRLLVEVGERLSEVAGDDIFVARLGGDEFGLIVGGDVGDLELSLIGERLCAAMQRPFDMGECTARMAASVGFAVYPNAAYSAQLLFERADYALYHAKTHATGETVLFSDEHEKQIQQIHGIERHLRDANLDEELSLVFQPIVNTHDGHSYGVEALARWNSPAMGAVPPDAFIAAAEKAGFINRLTEVLLTKALKAAANWPDNVFLSFNLSARDIGSRTCVDRLLAVLAQCNFPPERLCFEITETAVMQDYENATESLRKFREMGIQIALDDFGTGQSSLSAVRSMPLDKVKIDRSFIFELDQDATARAVVQTVIDLCRNLRLGCIVEGVETEAQLAALHSMRCFNIQGYLFSSPLSEEDIGRYLAAENKLGKSIA